MRSPRLQNGPRRGTAATLLKVGGALAAAALANYLIARRSERRHPPAGRFVEIDGAQLHYIERGAGPPVVLLHGNGATVEDFAISGMLDLVARNHRVIALDRPGFGHSERPRSTIWTPQAQARLIHKALRCLGVDRPVLVGHSWGTLVALAFALDYPADTAALVLLSGYYVPRARLDAALAIWPAIPLLGDVLRYTIAPLAAWLLCPIFVRKLFAPSPVSAAFQERFPTGLALRPSQIRASAADTALMYPGAVPLQRLGRLTMPVIIVAGSDDRLISTETQSGRLHRRVPGSDLQRIEGVGHMVHHDAPEQVAAAIEQAASAAG